MKKHFPLLIAALLIALTAEAQKAALNAIDQNDLRSHMAFFASDELKGRETGSRENEVAALYIKTNLMQMGMEPIDGTGAYFQMFPLYSSYLNPDQTYLRISNPDGAVDFDTDSLVFLVPPSNTGDLSGKVVFAGYGYADANSGYNDLEGISLNEKIVLVMKENPKMASQGKSSPVTDFSVESAKFGAIFSQNPKALLLVYNPRNLYRDAFASMLSDLMPGHTPGTRLISNTALNNPGIAFPIVVITQYTADMLLKSAGKNLVQLENQIIENNEPVSSEIDGISATVRSSVETSEIQCPNVIGIIEGSDPVLKNECIVYTAHFDHTGSNVAGEAFNGADDNASGSMALLEVAEAFMNLKTKPRRTIVFVWVNGEEKGLLGSRYYTDNPVIPMEKTLLNINLDMVGRSRMPPDTGRIMGIEMDVTQPGEIMVYTAHESTELLEILYDASEQSEISVIDKGRDLPIGGSDHLSFMAKGVPALLFHSGIHADVHKTGDDVAKIDFDKMEKVSRMIFLLGYQVADQKERFELDQPE